jgi:FemAB-related protein (PEP-CTERM system-associated)
MLVCRPFQRSDRVAWDAFVRAHPMGSPFHLMAWRSVLRGNFDYRPKYRVAVDTSVPGGQIVGVLPLFLVDNIITGSVLISTPFAVYGGILATSDAAHEILSASARALAEREGVQYLEMRNRFAEQKIGFDAVTRYATFTKDVAPMDAETLLATLPQKTRNLVRKARKFPYQIRETQNLDAFYGLLTRTYRRLGTPAFPQAFFKSIVDNFGRDVDVRELTLENRVVAACLNLFFRDQMHTYYAASAESAWAMGPNNYMYFEQVLWAGQNGFKVFDFGRSKIGTGPYQFKKHWGVVEHALPYEVKLIRRDEMPNFTPTNPTFEMAARMWRKLPLPVTQVLGPRLVALFP